ncbi:MAG: hypothetical protein HC815_36295 [Richelia sp. RM1_1_1]|nr:hypothetical protein [Richelia sp. RM1_1_1]
MKVPIIVYDDGDVLIFESVDLAENYLEPFDIHLYKAYDSEGHLLHLTPDGNIVSIELAETEPNHTNNLRQVIFEFLLKVGIQKDWLLQASLEDLILKSLEFKTQ